MDLHKKSERARAFNENSTYSIFSVWFADRMTQLYRDIISGKLFENHLKDKLRQLVLTKDQIRNSSRIPKITGKQAYLGPKDVAYHMVSTITGQSRNTLRIKKERGLRGNKKDNKFDNRWAKGHLISELMKKGFKHDQGLSDQVQNTIEHHEKQL